MSLVTCRRLRTTRGSGANGPYHVVAQLVDHRFLGTWPPGAVSLLGFSRSFTNELTGRNHQSPARRSPFGLRRRLRGRGPAGAEFDRRPARGRDRRGSARKRGRRTSARGRPGLALERREPNHLSAPPLTNKKHRMDTGLAGHFWSNWYVDMDRPFPAPRAF